MIDDQGDLGMTPSIRCESRLAGPGDVSRLHCTPNRPLDIGCLPESNDESPTDVFDDGSHVSECYPRPRTQKWPYSSCPPLRRSGRGPGFLHFRMDVSRVMPVPLQLVLPQIVMPVGIRSGE